MLDHVPVRGLRRGELAKRTGCNLETIRYYEKIGLLPEPPRNANGYRTYDDTDAGRLHFILRGRELGFAIEEIRGLLELVDGGSQTCAEVRARTEQHLATVHAKIADLQRIERVLTQIAGHCSGDMVPECPIIEALAS